MNRIINFCCAIAIILIATVGCEKTPTSQDAGQSTLEDAFQLFGFLNSSSAHHVAAIPPADIVSENVYGKNLDFWPYTGTSFNGSPQDPINLIFTGNADPRQIRAALFALDGDRTAFGFPNQAPFNSTWNDAIGDVQSGYGGTEGWTGSVIQLQCGNYEPARFHMRLFRVGDYTIANTHFEIQIPGTTEHQVLSWELAEQLVMIDLIRTGLLGAAPVMTSEINPPNYRTIPAQIYNLLPVELRAAIGGPLGDVASDVPIRSDGHAAIMNLAGEVAFTAETRVQDFIINFDQTLPKPFCASSEFDFLYLNGEVTLVQTTVLDENGKFQSKFHAEGILSATPVNPLTGEIVGETMEAIVLENHSSSINDSKQTATSWLLQKLNPASDDNAGWLYKRFKIDSKGSNYFEEKVNCN